MMPILLIMLVIAIFILGPLAVIWALNVLFGLTIAYTFYTWLAILVLGAFFSGNSVKVKK